MLAPLLKIKLLLRQRFSLSFFNLHTALQNSTPEKIRQNVQKKKKQQQQNKKQNKTKKTLTKF